MRLYDVENSAQEGLIDDTPLMDNTEFGQRTDLLQAKRNFEKLS